MERLWWSMAGPSRFLERIVEHVRQGRSVLMALPNGSESSVTRALRTPIEEKCGREWCRFSVSTGEGLPAAQLHARFAPLKTGVPATPQTLAAAERFEGCAVCLEGMTPEGWAVWKSFLAQFAHISRGLDEWTRPVFVVPLVDDLCSEIPDEDITLAHLRHDGVSDLLDMASFVARRARERADKPLVRRTRISVVAELAGTDPKLALDAVDWPLRELFAPTGRLRDWGADLGWGDEDLAEPRWERGCAETIDGRVRTHSAVLALQGQSDELMRRVWQGQVGVLFPFLESLRAELLVQLRPYLRVPYETPFGRVEDIRDLELGTIAVQIGSRPLPGDLGDRVRTGRRMRNALAHIEPVSVDDLQRAAGWG